MQSKNRTLNNSEDKEKWYKIKTTTPCKKENGFIQYKEVEGLIKSTDSKIQSESAFNWEAFGFKIFKDQPDVFVFDKKSEKLKKDNAPQFIKSVWDHIDQDGNRELTRLVLVNALHDEHVNQKLSKIICYHHSEWGVDYATLKPEVEALLNEGIKKEQDSSKKEKLEQKKEQILTNLDNKLQTFNLWKEVKVPVEPGIPEDWIFDPSRNVTRKRLPWEINIHDRSNKKEPQLAYFPTSPKVYHFHTMAFVEQMRRLPSCFCFKPISSKELKLIFNNANHNTITQVSKIINEIFMKFEINTCLRITHFFAQILEESGKSLHIGSGENLNYSAIRLKDGEYLNGTWINGNKDKGESGYYENGTEWRTGPFSYFKNNPDDADLYGRKDLLSRGDGIIQKANQQAIANRAYSNRYGNGDIKSDDGWKYRGKGLIQLTWKENYIAVNKTIQEKYSESQINIINNPDSILSHKGAIISAAAYWFRNGLNEKADKGDSDNNVDSITRVINKNTDSYNDRREHFHFVKKILNTTNCFNR
ncbi:hypothetical protein DMA11_01820 [Marinilabiliaceae bacterium JC017]|nr:hypothetical protein DMA11_01820 [Marinilabiliaceae bacterium JC017]